MGPLQNLVKKALDPFIWMGAAAMAASGLWLLLEGHWFSLWPAAMAFILSPILFPLLMIPAGFCAGVMLVTEKPFPRAARVFIALTFVWFVTLMAGYTFASFLLVHELAVGDTLIPALVWALSASVTPWAFFATRDRGNVFFTGLVFMTALVGAVLLPLAALYGLSGKQLFWSLWLVLGALVSIEALYEKYFFKPSDAALAAAAAQEKSAQTSAAPENKSAGE